MADKTYIVTFDNGKVQRVTVPADYRVTFGPLNPGTKGRAQMALRFYEGTAKDKQRAVFTPVESFRDESIPVETKVTNTKEKVVAANVDGVMRDVHVTAKSSHWKPADQVDHEPVESRAALPEAIEEWTTQIECDPDGA